MSACPPDAPRPLTRLCDACSALQTPAVAPRASVLSAFPSSVKRLLPLLRSTTRCVASALALRWGVRSACRAYTWVSVATSRYRADGSASWSEMRVSRVCERATAGIGSVPCIPSL